jgi:probable rRNA maturation factor
MRRNVASRVTPAAPADPNVGVVVSVVHDGGVDSALVDGVERAAVAALRQQGLGVNSELTVALVSAAEIRELNRNYRHIDAETDVLSFGMEEGQALPRPAGSARYLGDIAISVERARSQAVEYGHSVEREFAFLTVHGVLHLLGHDHHQPEEQRRMRAAEDETLHFLHLPRDVG